MDTKKKAIKKTTKPVAKAAQVKPVNKRQQRLNRLANANKVTFSLEPEVRDLCAAEATKAGMDVGHFLQRLVENHLLDHAEPGDLLAERLRAKRAVIDKTVELAQKLDQDGKFDEHFILTVMKTATQDADYVTLYEAATGAVLNDNPEKAKRPLNQQLGRLIKKAVGAKSKKNIAGTIARAQTEGEVISTYTLLEKTA
ncbi:hypothetical protein [Thalassovita taeanensis]|uniref:Uncharacterized protein n=1 Tax=Thalassovita taeanensis TaxID=657014 RepID=A0A1H9KJA2_9RHOB|nr:hypothetical protein [Thalassovita taeanensis]SEQ99178.1 hypothetical protein SAMN04488092_1194 [Thalassovita taeanensis]